MLSRRSPINCPKSKDIHDQVKMSICRTLCSEIAGRIEYLCQDLSETFKNGQSTCLVPYRTPCHSALGSVLITCSLINKNQRFSRVMFTNILLECSTRLLIVLQCGTQDLYDLSDEANKTATLTHFLLSPSSPLQTGRNRGL